MYNVKNKKLKKKILYKYRKNKRVKNPIDFNIGDVRTTITFSINNIFFNISCGIKKKIKKYSTLFWMSAGSKKFSKPQYKGSAKTTYIAHYALGSTLAQKLKILKFKNPVTIVIKGSTKKYLKAFFKSFRIFYKKKFSLIDLTPISLNGCRIAKARRT